MYDMNLIKRLKIDGWTYNPEIEDQLGSVYFDKDEDNYLRVTPIKNLDNTYVFTIVAGCEDREMYISSPVDDPLTIKNTEKWLKEILSKYEC